MSRKMALMPGKFYVQLGKYKKGAYQTKVSFDMFTPNGISNENRAYLWYYGYNCGNGYKKRLLLIDPNGKRTVLAHFQSI